MDRIANPGSVLAYITDRPGTRFKCYDLATRFKTNTTEMRAILEIIKDKIKISSTFKDKIYFVPSAAEIATQERQMRAQTTRPLKITMAKRQSGKASRAQPRFIRTGTTSRR